MGLRSGSHASLLLPPARAHCPDRFGESDDTDAAGSYHEGAPPDQAGTRYTYCRGPIAMQVTEDRSPSRSSSCNVVMSDPRRLSTTWCAGRRLMVIRWRSSWAVGGPFR